jgi:hypothetical protein
MDPTLAKLLATLIAIGALVATIWVPGEAGLALQSIAIFLVGGAWVSKPGDVPAPVPAPEQKERAKLGD